MKWKNYRFLLPEYKIRHQNKNERTDKGAFITIKENTVLKMCSVAL